MHTVLQRLWFVASSSLTSLALLAAIAAAYELFAASHAKARAPMQTADAVSYQPHISHPVRVHLVPGDEAAVYADVKLQCDHMFDWNTKEVFAMVFGNIRNSSRLLSDATFLSRSECAHATVRLPKYLLRERDLRGQKLHLSLTLNIVPFVGPLTNAHYSLLREEVHLPVNYTTPSHLNRSASRRSSGSG
jgi:hypothetical protein